MHFFDTSDAVIYAISPMSLFDIGEKFVMRLIQFVPQESAPRNLLSGFPDACGGSPLFFIFIIYNINHAFVAFNAVIYAISPMSLFDIGEKLVMRLIQFVPQESAPRNLLSGFPDPTKFAVGLS